MSNKLRYLFISIFCISLCLEIQGAEDRYEQVLTVLNKHSEHFEIVDNQFKTVDGKIADLTRQLDLVVNNLTNLVNFTNTLVPIGAIMEYSGAAAVPNNWLECNGDDKRQDLYGELFQVIQNTYGPTGIVITDGRAFSTFKLPDRGEQDARHKFIREKKLFDASVFVSAILRHKGETHSDSGALMIAIQDVQGMRTDEEENALKPELQKAEEDYQRAQAGHHGIVKYYIRAK